MKQNKMIPSMTAFLLTSALTVGLVGCSDNNVNASSSATTTTKVSTSECKTPAGQTFKAENAALIRQIAQAEASMGNDGFNCQ